jgi:hypothetical protein
MADLGKHVVEPVMLTSGMVIGVRTMDRVSKIGSKKSSRRKRRKKSQRSRKRKPSSNTYYCYKCKIRHRKNSKIGRSHRKHGR